MAARSTSIKPFDLIAVMNERDFRGTDLNLLVTFLVLMRERNVTRAAERLLLGQSAVSAALARLRKRFGDPLLVRSGQGMAPTPRAEALAQEIAPLLNRLAGLMRAGPGFDPARTERSFTLGMPDNIEVFLLPALLARAQAEAPGARFVLRPTDLHSGPGMLETGAIDLGLSVFGELPVSWGRRLDLATVGFACLYDGARLGIASPMPLEQYLALPHILVSFRGDLSGDVDAALAEEGLSRHVVMATRTFSVLPSLLRRTRTVATLPSFAAAAMAMDAGLTTSPPPIRVKPFIESMVWHVRTEADPAQRWLRRLVRDTYAERRARALTA